MIRVYNGRTLHATSEDAVSTALTPTGALVLLDDYERQVGRFPEGTWTRCVVEPD